MIQQAIEIISIHTSQTGCDDIRRDPDTGQPKFQSTHPRRDATLNLIKVYIDLNSKTLLTHKNF